MKTSQILASLFFGSLAAAVPINQRDLVTKTEMVIETVVVYTTVWDDEPVAEATTTAAAFYEAPASIAEAKPTTTSTPTPTSSSTSAAVQTPVSVYTPPVQTPSPSPEAPKPETKAAPKPETTAAPAPAPKPETTEAAPAPAPTTTEAAPVPTTTSEVVYTPAPTVEAAPVSTPSSTPSTGSSSGGEYSGDITIYEPNGALGACGTNLGNDEMVAAIATTAWGVSTYDVMTGDATNAWCGQKVKINYKGNTVEATIMDMCPGCSGDDLDLSPAAWKALTGSDEKTRYHGVSWSKAS